MRQFIVSVVALLFLSLGLQMDAVAQKARLKNAKNLLDKGEYQSSINIYLNVLDRLDLSEAKKGIAQCYWELKDMNEAEYWYGQLAALPIATPEDWFRYAKALHANQKYDLAEQWIKKYLDEVPNSNQGQALLKACDEKVIQELYEVGELYEIKNLKNLNTEYDEFGVNYLGKGIIFSSSRVPHNALVYEDPVTGDYFTEIFSADTTLIDAEKYEYKYGNIKRLPGKINQQFNDGPVSFLADGSEIYMTRNGDPSKNNENLRRLKIYKGKGDRKGNFTDFKPLILSSDEFSTMHPSLSYDGLFLIFASDQPGGEGALDLWISELDDDGRWSPSLNMGPSINTEGDEAFPFLHKDGTLYFSSTGQIGLGGYDVYSTNNESSNWLDPASWESPLNLGAPINSGADDFSFIINKEKTHGYFASDREDGEGKDDIYSFTKLSIEVKIEVVDKETGEPLQGAMVFTPCSPVEEIYTNENGIARIEMELGAACDFAAESLGYKPNLVRKNTQGMRAGTNIVVQIPLEVECIFDLVGTVMDGYAQTPLVGALVTLKSDCGDGGIDEQETVTDADGRYTLSEVPEGCDFRVVVNKLGYTQAVNSFSIADCSEKPDSFIVVCNCLPNNPNCPYPCSEGSPIYPDCLDNINTIDSNSNLTNEPCEPDNPNYPNCLPCNEKHPFYPDCDDVPIRPKNLLHIFYDFDAARIREDALPALEDLYAYMTKYSGATVLLTSHTDARGGKPYNKKLSNRRAKSVIKYLVDRGVDRSRLKFKGMGETVMLNKCYDGIFCTEEEHQENRRTEFQVVSYNPENNKTIEFKSRKPKNIITNPCKNCDSSETEELEDAGELSETLDSRLK